MLIAMISGTTRPAGAESSTDQETRSTALT
jgi:hypothetical protein